ncbi:MAG: hybrid sensor histidine kinase/response regulator [Planctomycetes bacterium]|nr:hybrid sensor histidine kinase/response regulator [Planctomycetota bacterium]
MRERLRVLMVTDVPGDVGLIDDELRLRGADALIQKADPSEDISTLVRDAAWDAIILGTAPDSRSIRTHVAWGCDAGEIPLILLTDGQDADVEVDALRIGVAECVHRDRPYRLVPAIERGRRERGERSHRRTAEAERDRLVLALEQAAEPIAIAERDGGFVYVNRAFEQIAGLDRETLLGQDPASFGSTNASYVYRRIRAAMRGRRSWSGNLRHQRSDGTQIDLQATVSPVRDGGEQEATHLVAVLRDVTEERRVQAQLVHSQKMEVLGRLVGGIAHDFNNFLTVVSGFAELLLASLAETDPLRRHATEIARAGKKAATLTRKLLTFSRKQDFEPRVLDLGVLLSDAEGMLQRLISADVVLKTSQPESPCLVEADPLQLEQVIMNLVVNARDAMPGGGRLSISSETVRLNGWATSLGLCEGRYVCLEVSDTGCGMSEETKARIFEPFFTTKPMSLGTGLGLSTVYGIVRQCGGAIEVKSDVGHGTRVRVYLPEQNSPARSTTPMIPTQTPDLRSGTVLIVEDETPVRDVVRRTLERHGYRVLEAGDAAEAQQVLLQRHASIDVAVCDVVMPGLSGPELAELVRVRYPSMKILFMSGYPESPRLLLRGAPFLRKPFPPSLLIKNVERLIEERRAQEAS